jgi:UDPglucose 6-dehydrogenase
LGVQHDAPQRIVEAAIEVNLTQRRLLVEKITAALGSVDGRTIAVLGLAFKPNTDDVREAPALFICRELARAGALIRAFDPVAGPAAEIALADVGDRIRIATDAYSALTAADALVIMTEWNEFRGLDLDRVRRLMARPLLVDSRNVLDPSQTRAKGFEYICTGRQALALQVIPV